MRLPSSCLPSKVWQPLVAKASHHYFHQDVKQPLNGQPVYPLPLPTYDTHCLLLPKQLLCPVQPGQHKRCDAKHRKEQGQRYRAPRDLFWWCCKAQRLLLLPALWPSAEAAGASAGGRCVSRRAGGLQVIGAQGPAHLICCLKSRITRPIAHHPGSLLSFPAIAIAILSKRSLWCFDNSFGFKSLVSSLTALHHGARRWPIVADEAAMLHAAWGLAAFCGHSCPTPCLLAT